MAKSFRPVLRDQSMLLPVDMREWLAEDHLVWFVLDAVEALDLTAVERVTRRRGGVGAAGYDPRMLLSLLVYAYCQGVRSSRQIERLCATDVAFRVLCAQDVPDHCTIARFRTDAKDAFTDVFAQVLLIAGRAGLGRCGTVAIDGTKIAANASIDANRGPEWFARQECAHIVSEAEQVDAADGQAAARDGGDPPDRVPAGLKDRSHRRERIRAAAAELDALRAQREQADQERQEVAARRVRAAQQGRVAKGRMPRGRAGLEEARVRVELQERLAAERLDRWQATAGARYRGRRPKPVDEAPGVIRAREMLARAEADAKARAKAASTQPEPTLVANTTDPQSRLMPTRKGFVQGYNTQVAVTGDQLIVAVSVGQSPTDGACFAPMMGAATRVADELFTATGNSQHRVGTVLADAGYFSASNLSESGPDRLIAPGKGRDHARAVKQSPASGPPPDGATPVEANAHRLRTPEGHALYKRRGATVEPGIGNLKKIISRFSSRGLQLATAEIHLAATAFNLRKIHQASLAT